MNPDQPEPLLRIGRTDIYVQEGRRQGNITRSDAEVLVSSCGTNATMRVGVSRAIWAKGGNDIVLDLRKYRPLVPGDVVITTAGNLPAKSIYHAVVLNWGQETRVLQAAIWRVVSRCMELAQLNGMSSIAFPSLGTGAGKAERFETHSTMAAACLDAIRPDSSLRKIIFCFNDPSTAETFRRAFLQQRLIRQTRGLVTENESEKIHLADNLSKIWPDLLDFNVNVKKLGELVKQLEQNPSATIINNYIASGDRAIVFARDVSDTTVVTGDRNVVGNSNSS